MQSKCPALYVSFVFYKKKSFPSSLRRSSFPLFSPQNNFKQNPTVYIFRNITARNRHARERTFPFILLQSTRPRPILCSAAYLKKGELRQILLQTGLHYHRIKIDVQPERTLFTLFSRYPYSHP